MIDIFFNNVRKLLTFTLVLIFAFVIVYTPQDFDQYNNVEEVFAFSGDIDPDLPALKPILILETKEEVRENVENGIFWVIAKQVVSNMVSDLVDWINSGFQGSPAFITDLDQFLLETADAAAGQFIEELAGDGSYLCSPFQLNIQIALAVEYDRIREDRPYEGCTLSDIVGSLEDFLSGSFIQDTDVSVQNVGGQNPVDAAWDNYLQVVNHPEKYTEFGVYLDQQRLMLEKIAEAERNETTKANWGDGYKSNKICETVDDSATRSTLRCTIVTPGRQIADALSENLASGQRTLIEADEINEIIGALMGQLGNMAITGAAGLLGLSANTGYTYSGFNGGSYTSAASSQGTSGNNVFTEGINTLKDTLAVQQEYLSLANTAIPRLQAYIADTRNPADKRQLAEMSLREALEVQQTAPGYITTLQNLIASYEPLLAEYNNANTTSARKSELQQTMMYLMDQYTATSYYSRALIDLAKSSWDTTTF
jgi:hypothetical protein